MKEYDAYLIDFDGTLFDTYESLIGVYQYSFRQIGEDCTPDDVAAYMHMSVSECCAKRNMKDPAKIKAFAQAIAESLDFPRFIEQIKIYPDVMPFVRKLEEKHKERAIVSGNTEKHISLVLARFGLSPFFKVIVGSDPGRRPKPFADPLLEAIRLLPSIPKDRLVYVGDSLQDPETAANASVPGILLERHGEYPDFRGPKIKTLAELL